MTTLALLLLAVPQVTAPARPTADDAPRPPGVRPGAPAAGGRLAPTSRLHVPHEYPTIQAAIDAARDGQTVVVDRGYFVENIDLRGKAITVQGQMPWYTTIDGSAADLPTVRCWNGEGTDTRLIGLGITGGTVDIAPGGGVSCIPPVGDPTWTSPYLADCWIYGNRNGFFSVEMGLGVAGAPVMERCAVYQNELRPSAPYRSFGGGVYGSPTMIGCWVFDNTATVGGGLALFGGAYLVNCLVQFNWTEAYYHEDAGGGGVATWGSVRILNTEIEANSAWAYDGGYCDYDVGTFGGAIRIMEPGLELLGCDLRWNTAGIQDRWGFPACGVEGGVSGTPADDRWNTYVQNCDNWGCD